MTRSGRGAGGLGLALLVAAAIAAAGCGGDDNGSTTPAGAATGTVPAGAEGVATAKQRLEALYAGESFKQPPSTTPKPQPGRNVWLVDFGLAAPAGQIFADFVKEAGKRLGWKVTVFDGKFSPDEYINGIRQAVAAQADGIVLYNIDCVLVETALRQARSAGVTIQAAESTDCDVAQPGADKLYDGDLSYTQGDWKTYVRAIGAAQADYLIAKTEGKADAIVLKETDIQTTVELYNGFVEELKICPACTVAETVDFTALDAGPKLQQKVEQALLKHPDANAVVTPIDDFVTAGVAAAIMGSGRNDQILSVAGGGLPANMDLIRKNRGEDGGYGISIGWEGYSAMDNLNRLFNGVATENSGIGTQVIDREHNVPASGIYQPPIDFKAIYEKAWSDAKG